MKETLILLAIGLLVWLGAKYLRKGRKKKEVKYISTYPNLTMIEFDFYDALNRYAPNDLILDRIASDQARTFANYCDALKIKANSHTGIGNRMYALQTLGATSVSEIYVGGYRTIETGVNRLKESQSHNRTMLENYTHIGVAVVNRHYVAIYFNIK